MKDISHECSDAHRRPQDLKTSIMLASKHLCELKPLQVDCQAEGSMLQQHDATTQRWTAFLKVLICLHL